MSLLTCKLLILIGAKKNLYHRFEVFTLVFGCIIKAVMNDSGEGL